MRLTSTWLEMFHEYPETCGLEGGVKEVAVVAAGAADIAAITHPETRGRLIGWVTYQRAGTEGVSVEIK